jgi:predicted site-specific integrase-resolvase
VGAKVGSGLNGERPKLIRVLSDPSASVIVVEHRDWLARFGVKTSDRRAYRFGPPYCGRRRR